MSVYTSDTYAFLIHIRFVRSAYYYVAKCWRAPRTCLQTWQTALSLVQVIYVMASYRTYGGSKLINEAILYFRELIISCKYESIPYLLYTRKPDMDEYTR